ncbi:MAG TPA: cytochrome c biogenesis protein CcdA [Methanosarcinales archaeon]|nr:cytochrome c biogenesis protein CcdA [Methanosarcinales archaeon]
MVESQISLLIALGAGIASVLSPCVLPLLPAIMAYSAETGKLRPIAIVSGLCISFTTMGVITSAFGSVVHGYLVYMETAAEIIIILLGLVMIFDIPIFDRFGTLAPQNMPREGLFGGLLLGLSLGIVWIPCVGPILGSVLAMVALDGDILYGGMLLFVYSLGLGIPMLGVAYLTSASTGRIRAISRHSLLIRRIAGCVLIMVGLGMVLGVYEAFCRWVASTAHLI